MMTLATPAPAVQTVSRGLYRIADDAAISLDDPESGRLTPRLLFPPVETKRGIRRLFPSGFGLGGVRRGDEGRQETGGPLVPGPWLYAYPLCTVLAGQYGTAAEIEAERAMGLVIEVELDSTRSAALFQWQGETFEVAVDDRGYPHFTKL